MIRLKKKAKYLAHGESFEGRNVMSLSLQRIEIEFGGNVH